MEEEGAPRVEVDLAKGASAASLLVTDAILPKSNCTRKLEGIRESFCDAVEFLASVKVSAYVHQWCYYSAQLRTGALENERGSGTSPWDDATMRSQMSTDF